MDEAGCCQHPTVPVMGSLCSHPCALLHSPEMPSQPPQGKGTACEPCPAPECPFRSKSQQFLFSIQPKGALVGMGATPGSPLDGKSQMQSQVIQSQPWAGKESCTQVLRKNKENPQRVKHLSILEVIFAGVSLGFISVTISHLLLNQCCWGNGVKLREIRGRNGSDVYINICLYYIEYCS